ncbi:MAG: HAMP domain-containing sensor histidine kinase [Acholeplasma sp.]|nr:HAMP domain-containing sensor histidine kinase [Acholeplasma sp.]
MTSFNKFFKVSSLRFFIIVFAIILLIANSAFYFISKSQYDKQVKRDRDSYLVMMVHLITMEDLETAVVYSEHYYHTQRIKISVFDSEDNLLFISEENPNTNIKYDLLSDEGVYFGSVYYDDESSVLGLELTEGIIILNAISLLLFISFSIILYRYLSSWYKLLESDFERIGSVEDNFNFSDLEELNIRLVNVIEKEKILRENQREYTKSIAHDFKTPLTVIRAYIEGFYLKRLELNDDAFKDLLEEVDNLDKLIPYFIEQELDYEVQEINVKGYIDELVQRFKQVFISKDLRLKLDIEDLSINISKIDLMRILDNIISNAFYYSKKGGEITISFDKDKVFIVKDNGIGMNEKTLELINYGYYRSKEAYSCNKTGSGLGLKMVREIVERLGYEFKIESKESVGTTVKVAFK